MNKDRIQKLVEQFNKEDYKTLFGALIVYEFGIDNVSDKDLTRIEKLYDKFMNNDYYTGLIDQDLREEF